MKQTMLIFLSLVGITNAFASMRVTFVKPPVTVKTPESAPKKASKGETLPIKTRVAVGKGGLAVLREKNGSTAKLSEGAKFEITRTQTESHQSKIESLYTLVKGAAFFYFPKKRKKDGKAVIRTQTAAIGVRGTEFFVSYGRSSESGQDVWTCVKSGIVGVRTTKQKNTVEVKSGEGVQLRGGREVSTPKPLPWTENLNWNMDPTKGSLLNTVSIEQAYASPLETNID